MAIPKPVDPATLTKKNAPMHLMALAQVRVALAGEAESAHDEDENDLRVALAAVDRVIVRKDARNIALMVKAFGLTVAD